VTTVMNRRDGVTGLNDFTGISALPYSSANSGIFSPAFRRT